MVVCRCMYFNVNHGIYWTSFGAFVLFSSFFAECDRPGCSSKTCKRRRMQYALVLKESTEALEEAILVAEHFFALHVLRKFAPERSHLLRFLVCLSEIVDLIIGTVSWAIDKFPNNVVYQHYIRSDNSHAHSLLYVQTYDYPKGRFLVQGKNITSTKLV